MLTTHERSNEKRNRPSIVHRTSGRGYPAPARKYLERSSLEILSVQEELRAIQEELQSRYEALAFQHSEWMALLTHVPVPLLLVDRGLNITFFNAAAVTALNLTPHDKHKHLGATSLNGLVTIVSHVIDSNFFMERDVQTPLGRWCSFTIRPLVTRHHSPAGALLMWSDIDEVYQSRERERAARADAERTSEQKDEVLRAVTAELQLPLDEIRGLSAVMRSTRMNEGEFHQTLECIERQADAQRRRVDELLAEALRATY